MATDQYKMTILKRQVLTYFIGSVLIHTAVHITLNVRQWQLYQLRWFRWVSLIIWIKFKDIKLIAVTFITYPTVIMSILGPCSLFEMHDPSDGTCTAPFENGFNMTWSQVSWGVPKVFLRFFFANIDIKSRA